MRKQFAVLGLGHFGGSLVKEFYEMGVEVLAVDKDEEKVNTYAQFSTHAVLANTMDENILKQIGIKNVDHVFVSLGENIESSILTTLLLKELGVKQVWVKAINTYHQKVLEKIGADRVIHPERDMAKRIAHHIVSEKLVDYIELSKEYSIVEIIASDKIHNKTLEELSISHKFGCNIVGIQTNEEIKISPKPDEIINKGDILIMIGKNTDLTRFEEIGV
ncbi:potassium channel family protein [Litchfieldia salsa]|uniref:Trk system potassium uptake protein TrkA n=1 Tax=Litchfieldia salsa TaxID=930152 RepID=A0A1H0QH07_9BACI|nr:TrkA family potassium uptake protein [Litchfieldia salsa]SDP16016.1 trk system potassium uptake protein TrkA [Litchfieldia salsa]